MYCQAVLVTYRRIFNQDGAVLRGLVFCPAENDLPVIMVVDKIMEKISLD
jgi:hypothetical protein